MSNYWRKINRLQEALHGVIGARLLLIAASQNLLNACGDSDVRDNAIALQEKARALADEVRAMLEKAEGGGER